MNLQAAIYYWLRTCSPHTDEHLELEAMAGRCCTVGPFKGRPRSRTSKAPAEPAPWLHSLGSPGKKLALLLHQQAPCLWANTSA